jgi:hypothetical protein
MKTRQRIYRKRTRRLGLLGVTIASLLSPAGKIIASSVVAAMVIGGVATLRGNTSPNTDLPVAHSIPSPSVHAHSAARPYESGEITHIDMDGSALPIMLAAATDGTPDNPGADGSGHMPLGSFNVPLGVQGNGTPGQPPGIAFPRTAPSPGNMPSGGAPRPGNTLSPGSGPAAKPTPGTPTGAGSPSSPASAKQPPATQGNPQPPDVQDHTSPPSQTGTPDTLPAPGGPPATGKPVPPPPSQPPVLTGGGPPAPAKQPPATQGNPQPPAPGISPTTGNPVPSPPSLPPVLTGGVPPATGAKPPVTPESLLPDTLDNTVPLQNGSPSTIAAVPEPSTMGLILLGLLSLVWAGRRTAAPARGA